MYEFLLALHSILRWFVLAAVIYVIIRAISGLSGKKEFTDKDKKFGNTATQLMHLQLLIGIILYFISPLMKHFLKNFSDAVQVSAIRFFGMEHTLMMVISVAVITIGNSISKKRKTDAGKFKAHLVWFIIGLLIILAVIPWPFSPMASRPWFRPFW